MPRTRRAVSYRFIIELAVLVLLGATLISQLRETAVPASEASPAQQSSCQTIGSSFIQDQQAQILPGYHMISSGLEHYDQALGSCMVEMDFRTAFKNATWGDNYVLFNATSGQIVADCFLEGGRDAAAGFCNNDGAARAGMIPKLSQQSFDELVAREMTQ
jgi:hypothetical protein